MILLALDTAMAACSVAVLRRGEPVPLAQAFLPMEKGHAEALAPLVQQVMNEAGLAYSQLSRIAVTVGPGTFTGVRIGLAFARGLGLALDIPVIGLDTLSAIAANSAPTSPRLVVADARKDEVYTALIGADGNQMRPPAVMALGLAAAEVAPGTLVLGTAADKLLSEAPRLTRSMAGDLPVAARFGALAWAMPAPASMPAPLYLRAADAKPQEGYALRAAARRVSTAGVESAALIAQMHGECFDNPWSAQAIASLMAMPGALGIIASEGEEPVGFLIARSAADEAEIITIGTRPFAQRRGVAAALLTEAATRLRHQGIARLFLEVAASNHAARALYAAAGFSDAGTRRAYYDRGHGHREDAVVMQRALNP
jgi:tRNA threonylcarbamoyl adenosine modification protein YeaZ/ribosomal-protein-alanine acetyltransferase